MCEVHLYILVGWQAEGERSFNLIFQTQFFFKIVQSQFFFIFYRDISFEIRMFTLYTLIPIYTAGCPTTHGIIKTLWGGHLTIT
jgi:hypothetical protein